MKKITRKNLNKFLAIYATKEKVLDLGSGGSSYGEFFPNRVTVDIDPNRKPDIVADAENLPFKDGEFSVVLSTEMLEHVRNPNKVEKEIRRVTAQGGTLILSTRFVFPLHDTPHDYWRFTKYGLQELFKEWQIIELIPETKNFSAVAVLLQRMSFQSTFHFNKMIKLILLLISWVFDHLNFLIAKEYGDIGRKKIESDIMPTGYYMVAQKRHYT
ncbi:MAG: class I SAM-dependent methyltransferase [Minisyncoccia bacterium]